MAYESAYDPQQAAATSEAGYPMNFGVEYPEGLSRLLIFVKWLLAIPHFIIIYALNAVFGIITLVAFFAILFTKKYPQGLFDMAVNIQRWMLNVYAYGIYLMRDEYPPFSWDPGQYPVRFDVEYPQELNRWAPLYKWILVIPHIIVLAALFVVLFFVLVFAWFAILFTGRFPRGMFDFTEGVVRWSTRVNVYAYLMRDEYPPFSLK
jgi:hypothetical protein